MPALVPPTPAEATAASATLRAARKPKEKPAYVHPPAGHPDDGGKKYAEKYPGVANGKRVTRELYDEAYKVWKDTPGTTIEELRLRFGVTWNTMSGLVKKGSFTQGWPSFRARLAGGDEAMREAKDEAKAVIVAEIVQGWEEARTETLSLLQTQKNTATALAQKLLEEVENVRFVHIKPARRQDGTVELIEVPFTALEATEALEKLSRAIEMITKAEALALGAPTERHEHSVVPSGWSKLSPEQMEYIRASGGLLPEGVTPEMLLSAVGS